MTSDTNIVTYGSGKWINGRWTPASEVPKAESEARLTSSKQGFVIPFRWEVALYVTLVTAALLLRLWGLGDRAVHHDESLHGFFAWETYQGRPYLHNPLTHGMFLFHTLAGTFFLFGDNDFTLRLPMALFGSALVLVPLLLRPRMGQVAALAAAVMITFSPALLYFSRFSRNDIFMAVFTLVLIGAMFRYIDERRERWIYVAAAVIALGFTAKETQYITVAILGAFLVWWRAGEIWDWLMGRRSIKEFSPAAGFLVVLGGLSLPMFAAIISTMQGAIDVTLAAPVNTPGLAAGAPEHGWGYGIAITTTVVFALIGWVIGLMWKPRVWIISWVIFAAIFSAFFTNFYTHMGGVGTGIWQSLGYWLAQQPVQRGGQPWYYYFILTSTYEFLPFVLAVGTAVFYAFRSTLWTNLMLAAAVALFAIGLTLSVRQDMGYKDPALLSFTLPGIFLLAAFAMTVRTTLFKRFLLFWSILTFAAFIFAGEKMPWLLTHLTLPLIIVSATSIGDIVMHIRWRFAIRKGVLLTLAGVPLFFLLLWRLIFIDVDGTPLSFFGLFLLLTTLGLLLVGQHWLGARIGHRAAWGSAALVIGLLMFSYTFRAAWIANYVYKDVPQEMIVYTQTTQELKNVANEIKRASQLTGEGNDFSLSIDTTSGFAWPWQWYLRGRNGIGWTDLSQDGVEADQDVEVAIVHASNNSKVAVGYSGDFTEGRRIEHRAWFPENYRDMKPKDVWDTIWHRDRWRGAIDYFIYRRLSNPTGSEDAYVYFNNDIPLSPLN